MGSIEKRVEEESSHNARCKAARKDGMSGEKNVADMVVGSNCAR